MPFSLKFDPDHNIMELNGSLVSLHCHHYNCGLLKVIESTTNIDAHKVLVETAAEEFFKNFKSCLSNELQGLTAEAALQEAAELYRLMGFGRLDLGKLTADGGSAYADSSYYVVSWLAKYGRRATPVCYFTCGYIAGILGAIFNAAPDTYEVKETECMMLGHDYCEFIVSKKSNGD